MNNTVNASRRKFIKQSAALGGGLFLAFRLPAAAQPSSKGADLTAWVSIFPDDSIVIRVARSEMGQGSSTGLPMLVAEELECDWTKVRHEFPSASEQLRRKRIYVTMVTGASRSIRDSHLYLRRAGAAAREMLMAAAAADWNVPAAECRAANSVITHEPSGRRTTYGAVAGAASKLDPPKEVKLKDPKTWKLLGTPARRFDIPSKVDGSAMYGIDVKVPGMVYAAIAQCPVFGGGIKSVDSSAALKMRGVLQVVQIGRGVHGGRPDGAPIDLATQQLIQIEASVAVVADNWWRAQQALKAVRIDWDFGAHANVSNDGILKFMREGYASTDKVVARRMGDVETVLAGGGAIVEAEYFAPYLNHATMEPMNCTAWVRDGKVDVWVGTQNPEGTMAAASERAGVPLGNVEVHKLQLGGGFGRRARQDVVHQAVEIAKAVGKPIKLLWSREEDMQHGFYRPASLTRMRAALDESGMPAAWHTQIACPSITLNREPWVMKGGVDDRSVVSFADNPYAVPNQLVENAIRTAHVPVNTWRGVGNSQNAFFRECFVDEMAHAGGHDPYEFRRRLLAKSARNLGVLDAVAKAAGWGDALPPGVHRGIAVQNSYNSFGAAVFEVSVSPRNELSIKRVVVAIDTGYVANIDSVRAQIEGNVAFGLTAALWGENTIKDGRVAQSNFHDYRLMSLREYPKVESVIVPTGGFWGGAGQTPLPPLAPALCNAIFAATSRRIRTLPLKHHGFTVA